jgi:putative hydrolase of the HAD superfamily
VAEVILNIVFDLGGVVFTWEPEAIIASMFAEPEVQAQVHAEIFGHDDWCELDRGTLPQQEAILRAAARTGLAVSAVAELMRQVPLALVVIPDTVDLLYRLKVRGHSLFYLSNMHVASIEHLERTYTFWDVFEGGIISCRIHVIKPEPAIYTSLLETYGLDTAETVFIDDTQVNLAAAAQFGIQTIRFEHPVQCEAQLKTLGII